MQKLIEMMVSRKAAYSYALHALLPKRPTVC